MIKKIAIFLRNDNKKAIAWKKRIEQHLKTHHKKRILDNDKPDLVIALGGDGTILEASRLYREHAPLMLGLNLGHVGFLASARTEKDFIPALDAVLAQAFTTTKRMMVRARVFRNEKIVREVDCLNEVTAQGLMNSVKMTVSIDGHPLQFIHGSGVIVSTPTGSTAYNLSAHGPIVTPDIHCMIVTELLDHHIPTPSMVVKRTKTIHIDVTEVRKRGALVLKESGDEVDAVMTVDDMNLFPLDAGDRIEVTNSPHVVTFIELEENYFLKSLQTKFAYR